MTTPQQKGRDFENKIQKLLMKTKLNVFREIDIKQRFGQNISGIDHLIEFDNLCICIQDKFQQTPISNSQSGHFITCVNNIANILQKKCIGIFISNIDLSMVAQQQIMMENSKNQNEFLILFDNITTLSFNVLFSSFNTLFSSCNIFTSFFKAFICFCLKSSLNVRSNKSTII